MKTIDQIQVSFYKNVYSKSPERVSLLQILEAVVQGKYASEIHVIRRYHAEGRTEDARKLKSRLQCFTASGTFAGAHSIRNLEEHSGIILVDYDHVAGLSEIRKLCAQDPHTVSVFQSPTDGLKIAAYVENADGRHREACALVSDYYNRLTGLLCDPACKDESRLCYVSYDPQGYVAALYKAFRLPDETAPEQPSPPVGMWQNAADPNTLHQFVMSYLFLHPATEGNRHSTLFKIACEACRRGYAQDALFGEICERMAAPDFDEKEIMDTLLSGYKSVADRVDHRRHAQVLPSQKDKGTKGQYSTAATDEAEDETYWQGEEFRRQTPFFSDQLYENIPSFLRECIIDNITRRERDLLLLSSLTAFSSVIPGTWGVYDKRRYSPHLFSVGIAPAGSGKSIVQLGRSLLDTLQERILGESEAARKKYKNQHREWMIKYSKKLKGKESTEIEEEPQEPPFRLLVVPATISYTRMQMQLRDNGDLGGIIFDTEAQSLSNANRLDCGHFDDMLCKAFGHETISSSYKANGMKPVIVHRPRLALSLTGTPAQFYQLVDTPENGLFSRILLYTYREDPVWKEMGGESETIDEMFEALSERTYQLYLFCLKHPMRLLFTRRQWTVLNREFAALLSEVVTHGNDNLQAVVKRHGFMVMRVAMICTRLRQFEENSTASDFYCTDTDFETAFSLVRCCYEHSRLLLASMASREKHVLKNPNQIRDFLEMLPDLFTTEEARKLAEIHSIGERRLRRLLKNLNGLKINKLSHGSYEKIK